MQRMRFRASGAAVVACALLVTACSSDPDDAPEAAPASPTEPAAGIPPSAARKPAVRATVKAVRDYLDTWVSDGPAAASRYLVPSQRVTSDEGMPKLESGSVESAQVWTWQSPSTFTLLVTMDLHFDGTSSAWNRGVNSRFVTPHRQGPNGPYLLELATSP